MLIFATSICCRTRCNPTMSQSYIKNESVIFPHELSQTFEQEFTKVALQSNEPVSPRL